MKTHVKNIFERNRFYIEKNIASISKNRNEIVRVTIQLFKQNENTYSIYNKYTLNLKKIINKKMRKLTIRR